MGRWGGTALESGTESPGWHSVARIDVLGGEVTCKAQEDTREIMASLTSSMSLVS